MRKTNSQKEKQASQIFIFHYLTVGHVPDALVEILFRLMVAWKINSTKAIFSENLCAAPEGK